jgi:hypothetical protein
MSKESAAHRDFPDKAPVRRAAMRCFSMAPAAVHRCRLPFMAEARANRRERTGNEANQQEGLRHVPKS